MVMKGSLAFSIFSAERIVHLAQPDFKNDFMFLKTQSRGHGSISFSIRVASNLLAALPEHFFGLIGQIMVMISSLFFSICSVPKE